MNTTPMSLETVRRRVFTALVVREAAVAVAAVCFAIGLVILIARAALSVEITPTIELWPVAAIGLVIITGYALFRAWSLRPTPSAFAAWTDARLRAGGAIMNPDPQHGTHIDPTRLRVRTEWRGIAGALASGLAVLLAAGFAPLPVANNTQQTLAIDQNIEGLKEDAQTLEQLGVIEEQQREHYDASIQEVAERADAHRPGETWEALDRLADEMARQAAMGLEQAQETATAAGTVEQMASALSAPSETSPAGLEQAVASAIPELEGLVASGVLDPALLDQLQRAIDPKLTDEQRAAAAQAAQQLAEALGNGQCKLADALANAGMARLSDSAKVALAREAAREALRDYLAQCNSANCRADGVCLVAVGAGRAGVSRGPGAVRMSFHDAASPVDDAAFTAQRLDGALEPDGSVVAGLSRSAQTGELGTASDGGVIDAANAGASYAIETRHLPRHRQAIRTFFERADRPSNSPPEGSGP